MHVCAAPHAFRNGQKNHVSDNVYTLGCISNWYNNGPTCILVVLVATFGILASDCEQRNRRGLLCQGDLDTETNHRVVHCRVQNSVRITRFWFGGLMSGRLVCIMTRVCFPQENVVLVQYLALFREPVYTGCLATSGNSYGSSLRTNKPAKANAFRVRHATITTIESDINFHKRLLGAREIPPVKLALFCCCL